MNRVPPTLVIIVITLAFGLTLVVDQPAPASAPTYPEASAVQASPGYRVDLVADGFANPTALAVGNDGSIYIAQTGDNPERSTLTVVGSGLTGRAIAHQIDSPITGLTWHKGALYATHRGAISVVRPATGEVRPFLTNLPDVAGQQLTAVSVGPDGKLYFGLGAATNAAIVEPDAPWLRRSPAFADPPCQNVKLRGANFSSDNPLTPDPTDKATTGAFQPFGVPTSRGQTVQAAMPCTGALLRVGADGAGLELVAWGLRAPTAPAFDESGRLWVATRGMTNHGSRPVPDDPDALYRVEQGAWYGWPDFTNSGRALNPLLLEHPWSRPETAALLGEGAGPSAVLSSPRNLRLHGGALIALQSSGTVVHVTPEGRVTPFLASRPGQQGLVRPVGLAAGPDGVVYVLDRGETPGQGALWRISRAPASGLPVGNRFSWALVGAVCVCAGTAMAQFPGQERPDA